MLDPGSEMDTFFVNGFRFLSNTTEMKKLKSGFLIKEMLERFTQKINKTLQPSRSIWIYSGHDVTISNLLNSLGLFNVIAPNVSFTFEYLSPNIFHFYSLMFHHTHHVCFLNCINPKMTFMFNYFTKIQVPKLCHH